MSKSVAALILSAITTASATMVVQFPQYAVWFTLAGVLAAGALKSPLFTPIDSSEANRIAKENLRPL